MLLTKQKVKRICELSRIEIDENELNSVEENLNNILDVIVKVSEVKTEGIEPLVNVSEQRHDLRTDEVTDGNIRKKVLANAKDSQFDCFVVPKVIE